MDLYAEVVQMNIPHDSHASDLYLPVNKQTRDLLKTYEFLANVQIFVSQIDGKLWYDVPFAYRPYWDSKTKKEG
jgi:hypothetical protein